jgi:hypothetical protein
MTLNLKIDSVIMRHDLMRNETKETIEQLEEIADDFAIGFAEWVHNNCDERMDIKIEWVTEEGDEWAIPFVEAVYRVWDKFEIENIKYCW